MPQYRVTDPETGKTLTITGSTPPTEAELDGIFKAARSAAPDPIGSAAAKATNLTGPMSLTDRALGLLPTVLGGAGGFVGGRAGIPGRVGGGAIGGGAGEAIRGAVNKARGVPWAPETWSDYGKDIATQAAIQGGLEIGGSAASGLAKSAGRAAIENSVRAPVSLQRQFPNIVDTIVEERLPVGRGIFNRTPGSQQAAAKLRVAGRETKALLARAEASGVRYKPEEVAEPVKALLDDITKQPLPEADAAKVKGMLAEFLRSHPGPLTPIAVKELKQRAQALASVIYRAEEKGNVIPADQAIAARFNKAIGEGAKAQLENPAKVGSDLGRKIGGAERHSQRLIGATRAISQAEMRRLPLWAEAASLGSGVAGSLLSPGSGLTEDVRRGALTYLLVRGMASPRALSRTGLALTQPQLLQLYRQFPRLAQAAVSQAAMESRESQTPPERQ